MLVQLKDRFTGTVKGMQAEALENEGTPTSENVAEHGSQYYDQEVTLSLVENEQERIQEIDAALARIETGAYGKCESCEDKIAKPRLDSLPFARLCVDCQEVEDERGAA